LELKLSSLVDVSIELTGFYAQHSENSEIMSQKESQKENLEEVLKYSLAAFRDPIMR
jgi:hypothetical protein